MRPQKAQQKLSILKIGTEAALGLDAALLVHACDGLAVELQKGVNAGPEWLALPSTQERAL